MNSDIQIYNDNLNVIEREICNLLEKEISSFLPISESKIWHRHPVWFLNSNPIVGYSKMKNCIQLLFWSGQSFDEANLKNKGSFKASEIRYTSASQVNTIDLCRWLQKAETIQWDYKNLIKRKGILERIK